MCIYLKNSHVKCLSMSNLTYVHIFLCKASFHIVCPVLNWIVGVLFLWILSVFQMYAPGASPLSNMCFATILFQFIFLFIFILWVQSYFVRFFLQNHLYHYKSPSLSLVVYFILKSTVIVVYRPTFFSWYVFFFPLLQYTCLCIFIVFFL